VTILADGKAPHQDFEEPEAEEMRNWARQLSGKARAEVWDYVNGAVMTTPVDLDVGDDKQTPLPELPQPRFSYS
jgi:hypothetical protein